MILALLLACVGQPYSGTTDERGTVTLWLGTGTYAFSAVAEDGWTSEVQEVHVNQNGASVILVMRPGVPVWVRVLMMTGQRPDLVWYALYACSECKNQLATIAESLDVGPPLQAGEACPLCGAVLTSECHRGLWQGGGADPVEWVGGVDVTAERTEEN